MVFRKKKVYIFLLSTRAILGDKLSPRSLHSLLKVVETSNINKVIATRCLIQLFINYYGSDTPVG